MPTEQFICSKMFTDLNVRMANHSIKNCCKSNDASFTYDEINVDYDIFNHNKEALYRKAEMLFLNRLPEYGCSGCVAAEPNSLFRSWNEIADTKTHEEKLAMYDGDELSTFEISMSSVCDLKCTYCGPKDSSTWARELGVSVEAPEEKWKDKFNQRFEKYLKNKTYDQPMYHFFLSGGEPTYNPDIPKMIRTILELVPNDKLTIIINTNANTKEKIFNRYMRVVRAHPDVQWVYDCSVDGLGKQAEAIRTGLVWERFERNIRSLLAEPTIKVRVSPTVNMYSIPDMLQFVTYFHKLFEEYNNVHEHMFNMNMVQETPQSPWSMPAYYASTLDASIQYCVDHDLRYAEHLKNVQQLIGTKINERTASHIRTKWNYFKSVRSDIDWEQLFPHIPKIIEELKNNEDINKR